MERKDLEAKLRAIQDLKAERYIGTQEAFGYINRAAALYDNPNKMAKAINQYLGRKLEREQLYYPATAERVVGLMKLFDELSEELEEEKQDDETLGGIILSETDYFFLSECDTETLFEYKEGRVKELFNYLKEVFENAQLEGMDDKEFGEQLAKEFIKKFPLGTDRIRELLYHETEQIDWNYLFSKDNLRKVRAEYLFRTEAAELDVETRTKRILKDQVENRIERKKEIVMAYLTQRRFTSYHDAISTVKRLLEKSEKRLKGLENKKFLEGYELLWLMSDPKSVIERFKDSYAHLRFVLSCLASEKSFAVKYLQKIQDS